MKRHFIRHFHRETQLFKSRVYIAMMLIGAVFCLLMVRLFYLQVLQHDVYTTLSDQNRIAVLPLPPNRGLIYDRNGVLLANNVPTFSIHIVPEQTENIKETLAMIKKLIPLTDEDITRFYKEEKRRRQFEGVPLLLNITEDQAAIISINSYRLPGVNVVGTLMRDYPLGAPFAHLLGYVGRINEDELKALDPDEYRATLYMGKTGLEKYHEDLLHGEVGYQKVETDARGRVLRILETKEPTSGTNLYLSIDSKLQLAAEKALSEGKGAVVAIEPKTGEILAFVSKPGFDPNVFVKGIDHASYKALSTDPDQPLYNRALRGLYPPASTVKPLSALQALEKGFITTSFSIWDPGFYQLGGKGRPYRDWWPGGHGQVNVLVGIMLSCDVFFYTVAHKMEVRVLGEAFTKFGYGTKTGVDIFGETGGLVPTPEWKKGRYNEPWYPGETISMGIGQSYTVVTPLQLAHAAATFANRGIRIRPHAVATKGFPDGTLVNSEPEYLAPVVASDANWDIVLQGMKDVVQGPRGTARKIANPHYLIAGKTGTAQVYTVAQNTKYHGANVAAHLRDHSLFIGFAPADDPKIAVGAVSENYLHQKGAYVAKEVFDAYLVPPEVLAEENAKKDAPAPAAAPAPTTSDADHATEPEHADHDEEHDHDHDHEAGQEHDHGRAE
jgi:penicillin-binding protein 2